MLHPNSNAFTAESTKAIADPQLQEALGVLRTQSIPNRLKAANNLAEFEQLRDRARDLKDHILGHLDQYLLQFEEQVKSSGGQVHWCSDAESARQTILKLCREAGAKTVTKGKTMIGEEIGINDFLAENGIEPVETDLGEYIIQLRHETPSHIIGPALHVTKRQVEETFREHHTDLDAGRSLEEPAALMAEARAKMRHRYFEADVGITGANFLIAETGSTVIVTNEGNGDLTQMLPKMHIALTSIEKVVPTLDDAMTLLRILPRSATGQELSVYVTFSTGPRRQIDPDGPKAFHVVLLDNGRSAYLGGPMQEMLRCIRCGACMDHCPVYHAVGGHAYGWVYPGPIGAILTPALVGVENAKHLPNASSLCGRCESVCPVRIPIPKLLRHWREEEFTRAITPATQRTGLGVWAWFAQRPAMYRLAARWSMRILRWSAGARGRFKSLPLAEGWTRHRDFPAPQGKTFQDQWRARSRR
ncbi:LutB/LldF family L-lactate oxidation iron-sulfur protein [Dongia sedimenti]|uniref:LutB/LldF family L-lactate oxidation iron-sulfur protein n=1 Tax=Dongia sedimenti TaxID=3064282 RepID=A0ABU0YMP8_9PROT|nr:LutB/LldF family L-lactate oxidation iron-sulfur protein [Rhodospirillaceae bacterium R-7]